MFRAVLLTLLASVGLYGCEQLGLDTARQAEAEGKAVGAACRHAGRALEDCYQLNPAAPKAAVFQGWREMNDYMSEQKLEVVRPALPPALPKALRNRQKEEQDKTPEGQDAAEAPAHGEASAPAAEASPASTPEAAPRKGSKPVKSI